MVDENDLKPHTLAQSVALPAKTLSFPFYKSRNLVLPAPLDVPAKSTAAVYRSIPARAFTPAS